MRYNQLHAMRGIAALTVFFSHFIGLYVFDNTLFQIIRNSPLHIFYDGAAAVTFFFVLSGFVLSLQFIDNKKQLNLFSFYFKRIFRIYPVFIFVIFLSLFIKHYLFLSHNLSGLSPWIQSFWKWDFSNDNCKEIIKTLFLIGPNFNADLIDPVIWSLVVEMKVSFLIPFFIYIISKTNFVLNAIFLASFVFCTSDYWSGIFIVGILLAKYKEFLLDVLNEKKRLIIPITCISIIFYTCRYSLHFGFPQNFFLRACGDFLIAIASSIFILLALMENKVSRILQNSFFKFLGDISYSFYLVHMPLLLICCSFFSTGYYNSPILIFFVLLFSSIVAAKLLFNFIEIPFQKLCIRISESKKNFFESIKL